MEKTSEDLEIAVQPKEEQVAVKSAITTDDIVRSKMPPYFADEVLLLTTGEEGSIRQVTRPLNGKLHALLIKVQNENIIPFDLRISPETLPLFALFEEKGISVQRPRLNTSQFYIPIKVDHWNVNKSEYGSPDFWVVNEPLIVTLAGAKQFEIELRIRYSVC